MIMGKSHWFCNFFSKWQTYSKLTLHSYAVRMKQMNATLVYFEKILINMETLRVARRVMIDERVLQFLEMYSFGRLKKVTY